MLTQQLRAPGIPSVVGRVDVRDRERIEIIQALFGTHGARELADHLGVGQIPALGRCGHEQVFGDQPAHEFRVGFGQAMAASKSNDLRGSEFRMVAALTFTNVVIQPRDVQQLRFRHGVYGRMCNRERCGARLVAEAAQIAQQQHRMGVDRIDVEQVVLHLPDDAPEFGQVLPSTP